MQRMTDDANLTAISPRTWTARVQSFLPWDGEPSQGFKARRRGGAGGGRRRAEQAGAVGAVVDAAAAAL